MADTIKVPGFSKPLPTWAVGTGLGAVAVAIVLYYRHKSQAAQPAAASGGQYPPDGTTGNPADPYSTDPATGQTYGNEAIGAGGTFGAFGTGGGSGGSGWDPNTGLFTDPNGNTCTNPGGNGYCPGSGPGGPPFATNDAWAGWVIQQMQALNPNLDVGALTDALGLYLAGQPVSAAQKTLVLDAEAIGGPPPVAGANGYPPNVRTNGGGGGHGAQNPVTGLKVTSQGATGVDIAWDAAQGATGYQVKSTKGTPQMTGAASARIRSVNAPGHSGASATVTVLATPAQAGAKPASITVKTKK